MTAVNPLFLITQQLSGRWTIPILLSIQESGGRFTPLQHRLGISPSRLSDNLRKLEQEGIVKHLTPYERRHPLLPEYQLTDKGLLLREAALALQAAEQKLDAGPLSEKAWNWPIMIALDHDISRFQAIRQALITPTPRIISTRIQELNEVGIVHKNFAQQPRPGYVYKLESFVRPIVRETQEHIFSLL